MLRIPTPLQALEDRTHPHQAKRRQPSFVDRFHIPTRLGPLSPNEERYLKRPRPSSATCTRMRLDFTSALVGLRLQRADPNEDEEETLQICVPGAIRRRSASTLSLHRHRVYRTPRWQLPRSANTISELSSNTLELGLELSILPVFKTSLQWLNNKRQDIYQTVVEDELLSMDLIPTIRQRFNSSYHSVSSLFMQSYSQLVEETTTNSRMKTALTLDRYVTSVEWALFLFFNQVSDDITGYGYAPSYNAFYGQWFWTPVRIIRKQSSSVHVIYLDDASDGKVHVLHERRVVYAQLYVTTPGVDLQLLSFHPQCPSAGPFYTSIIDVSKDGLSTITSRSNEDYDRQESGHFIQSVEELPYSSIQREDSVEPGGLSGGLSSAECASLPDPPCLLATVNPQHVHLLDFEQFCAVADPEARPIETLLSVFKRVRRRHLIRSFITKAIDFLDTQAMTTLRLWNPPLQDQLELVWAIDLRSIRSASVQTLLKYTQEWTQLYHFLLWSRHRSTSVMNPASIDFLSSLHGQWPNYLDATISHITHNTVPLSGAAQHCLLAILKEKPFLHRISTSRSNTVLIQESSLREGSLLMPFSLGSQLGFGDEYSSSSEYDGHRTLFFALSTLAKQVCLSYLREAYYTDALIQELTLVASDEKHRYHHCSMSIPSLLFGRSRFWQLQKVESQMSFKVAQSTIANSLFVAPDDSVRAYFLFIDDLVDMCIPHFLMGIDLLREAITHATPTIPSFIEANMVFTSDLVADHYRRGYQKRLQDVQAKLGLEFGVLTRRHANGRPITICDVVDTDVLVRQAVGEDDHEAPIKPVTYLRRLINPVFFNRILALNERLSQGTLHEPVEVGYNRILRRDPRSRLFLTADLLDRDSDDRYFFTNISRCLINSFTLLYTVIFPFIQETLLDKYNENLLNFLHERLNDTKIMRGSAELDAETIEEISEEVRRDMQDIYSRLLKLTELRVAGQMQERLELELTDQWLTFFLVLIRGGHPETLNPNLSTLIHEQQAAFDMTLRFVDYEDAGSHRGVATIVISGIERLRDAICQYLTVFNNKDLIKRNVSEDVLLLARLYPGFSCSPEDHFQTVVDLLEQIPIMLQVSLDPCGVINGCSFEGNLPNWEEDLTCLAEDLIDYYTNHPLFCDILLTPNISQKYQRSAYHWASTSPSRVGLPSTVSNHDGSFFQLQRNQEPVLQRPSHIPDNFDISECPSNLKRVHMSDKTASTHVSEVPTTDLEEQEVEVSESGVSTAYATYWDSILTTNSDSSEDEASEEGFSPSAIDIAFETASFGPVAPCGSGITFAAIHSLNSSLQETAYPKDDVESEQILRLPRPSTPSPISFLNPTFLAIENPSFLQAVSFETNAEYCTIESLIASGRSDSDMSSLNVLLPSPDETPVLSNATLYRSFLLYYYRTSQNQDQMQISDLYCPVPVYGVVGSNLGGKEKTRPITGAPTASRPLAPRTSTFTRKALRDSLAPNISLALLRQVGRLAGRNVATYFRPLEGAFQVFSQQCRSWTYSLLRTENIIPLTMLTGVSLAQMCYQTFIHEAHRLDTYLEKATASTPSPPIYIDPDGGFNYDSLIHEYPGRKVMDLLGSYLPSQIANTAAPPSASLTAASLMEQKLQLITAFITNRRLTESTIPTVPGEGFARFEAFNSLLFTSRNGCYTLLVTLRQVRALYLALDQIPRVAYYGLLRIVLAPALEALQEQLLTLTHRISNRLLAYFSVACRIVVEEMTVFLDSVADFREVNPRIAETWDEGIESLQLVVDGFEAIGGGGAEATAYGELLDELVRVRRLRQRLAMIVSRRELRA
ncbi:hypothetical protein GMRT_14402 [Giardia muris]|uniref:Uncharacterized protein n=1 Tax=Giardia muris TaxID=5742 RepID=A0A4Z1T6Y3_GIAMU|nr:hypothetical protein GMRT_14402 [Giardia muris]|eukprot:TNJ28251.1 hypothetical protein GMRT_14402 [Giardia muris]